MKIGYLSITILIGIFDEVLPDLIAAVVLLVQFVP
jgi:hypothetical protein